MSGRNRHEQQSDDDGYEPVALHSGAQQDTTYEDRQDKDDLSVVFDHSLQVVGVCQTV